MAHARLVGLVNTMSERSSGGRSRGGRYLKPDTARRHFIFHIAFENLQRGVLPTPHDFDMLFGPAPVINVPSTPEMQRWIDERSGWREKASTRELPASGEQTLLARYFSVGPRASTLARAGARPGRPPDYVFDFGNFEGVALKKMFLRSTLARKPSTNRATGEDFWQHGPDYIKWLAGDEFDWQFPKHTLMYLELKASIGRPLELSSSRWLLPDLRRAAAAFDDYMKDAFPSLGAPSPEPATPSQPIVRWLRPQLGLGLGAIQVEAPVRAKCELRVIVDGGGVLLELDAPDDDGDATEIRVPASHKILARIQSDGTELDAGSGSAKVTKASTVFTGLALLVTIPIVKANSQSSPTGTYSVDVDEDLITSVDYMSEQDAQKFGGAVIHGIPKSQWTFFQTTIADMNNVNHERSFLISDWDSTKLLPPKVDSYSAARDFDLRPITFIDPTDEFKDRFECTPCVNHGYDHSNSVTRTKKWSIRRVKGMSGDEFIASRYYRCSKCRAEANRLNALIAAAASNSPRTHEQQEALEDLKRQRSESRYEWNASNPRFHTQLYERAPDVVLNFKFYCTHRAAITVELLFIIKRSIRTAQQPADVEALLAESRAEAYEKRRLSYHGARLQQLRRGDQDVLPLEFDDVDDGKLSDTWIRDVQDAFVHSKEAYITQFFEQQIEADVVQLDHSLKRFARQREGGQITLKNNLAMMNELGLVKFWILTETTSYNDPRAVAAFNAYRKSCIAAGIDLPRLNINDNPARDARAIAENLWMGGRDQLRFEGDVVLCYSEPQCDAAVAELVAEDTVGFDTENVAFVDGSGTNIDAAAIVQIATRRRAYIFVVHSWSHLYVSFKLLMSSVVKKVAVNVSHDVASLRKRFDDVVVNSTEELTEMARAAGQMEKLSLQGMGHYFLDLHVDKRVDHSRWQDPLDPAQIAYAATDAYAHLIIYEKASAVCEGHEIVPVSIADGLGDDEISEVNTSCSRHGRAGREVIVVEDGEPGEPGALQVIDGVDGAPPDPDPDVDEDDDGAPREDETEPPPNTSARKELLSAARRMIQNYATNLPDEPLHLRFDLTPHERKLLHEDADGYALYHYSSGSGPERHVVVSKWKAWAPLNVSEGAKLIQSLVQGPRGRGYVQSFNADALTWRCVYGDDSSCDLDIDALNEQMQQRYLSDHGRAGLGTNAPIPIVGSSTSEDLYQSYVDGINPNWHHVNSKYDPRHWMANFLAMASADKKGDQFKLFATSISMATFRICKGEYREWTEHALRGGLAPERVKKLRRKYYRIRAKYKIEEPRLHIRALLDVVLCFSTQNDALNPASKFFTSGWKKIFDHELKYVQYGRLADKPGMAMYIVVGKYPVSGKPRYRSTRTSSPLEGMHAALNRTVSPAARAAGVRQHHVRALYFYFGWNVDAGRAAGVFVDVGHLALWLVDALVDMYKGQAQKPELLTRWRRVNTTIAPTLLLGCRGVPPALEFKENEYQPPSMQRTTAWFASVLGHPVPSPLLAEADIKKVLAHPELVAKQNVHGLYKETSIYTSVRALQSLNRRMQERSMTNTVLAASGTTTMLSRIRAVATVDPGTRQLPAPAAMEMDASPAPLPVMDDARLARPTFVPPVVALAAPAPRPAPAARPQSLTLTLAEIDGIKGRAGRKRLRWWCTTAIPGECTNGAGDPERRDKLKRKLEALSGTFTVSDAGKLDKYPWPS